jgi:hypothetical protein
MGCDISRIIEVGYSEELIRVLGALRIPWSEGRPPNGRGGIVRVQIDAEGDGRIQAAIGSLADLRWRYEPGRRLQLAFDLEIPEVGHGTH